MRAVLALKGSGVLQLLLAEIPDTLRAGPRFAVVAGPLLVQLQGDARKGAAALGARLGPGIVIIQEIVGRFSHGISSGLILHGVSFTHQAKGRVYNPPGTGSIIPFVEPGAVFQAGAFCVSHSEPGRPPHGNAGIGAVLADEVELQTEVGPPLIVQQPRLPRMAGHPAQDLQARVFRRHSPAHQLHGVKAAQVLEVGLAPAGAAAGAYVIIHVQSGADNGRVPHPARYLIRQAAGSGDARDVAAAVHSGTVNSIGVPVRPRRSVGDGPVQQAGVAYLQVIL